MQKTNLVARLISTIAVIMVAGLLSTGCGRDPWWANPNNTWMRTFGGEVCNDVLPSDDGGYFMVGMTRGLDNHRNTFVVRVDSSFGVVWSREYARAGHSFGNSIIPDSGGNLLIAGSELSSDEKTHDAYLLLIDKDGNELWSRSYSGPLDEMVRDVKQVDDGGYILFGDAADIDDFVADPGMAGYSGYQGRSSIFLLRTDSEGIELWRKIFDTGENTVNTAGELMPDGGFIVMATNTRFPEADDDALIIRLDKNGDQIWSNLLEDGRIAGHDIVGCGDGSVLLCCSFATADDLERKTGDFLFLKIDSTGKEIWRNRFGDPDMIDYGAVVNRTEDGCFIAAGGTRKEYYSRNEDIVLVKLDKNGKPIWQKTYETATHNMFATVFQCEDKGFLISGSTIVEDGSFDMFIIKCDGDGNLVL